MDDVLPTKAEQEHWTPNGFSFDPLFLDVKFLRADDFGNREVAVELYGNVVRDCFDPSNGYRRQKFREKCFTKLGIEPSAETQFHEALEEAINAKARAADSEPLVQCSTVRMSDVEPEQVEWLWRERIAIGKLTLIVGDPGVGKTFLTHDIASRVSRGAVWPDNSSEPQPVGDVILLTAEDDLADTVRPRLDAHDADVSRIIAINGAKIVDDADSEMRMINLAIDLDSIRRVIERANQPRLIVIDPISAYLGRVDSHRNTEVRNVLAPLSDFASGLRVAVIAVTHLRKGEGEAMHRTMGSLAFVAAARSAWVICRDAADPKRRLMLPLKSNNAPDTTGGLAFAIQNGSNGAPVVCWEAEPVTTMADDAIGPQRKRRGPAPDDRAEAAEWLRTQLANGPRPKKEIVDDGDGYGFSQRTLERAFREIDGRSKLGGFPAVAVWSASSANGSASCATHKQLGEPGETDKPP